MRPGPIRYPDSDGKPIGDGMRQIRWIILLAENLESLFARRDDVFVGMSNLWYPVEGHPEIRLDPDVYVVFGRPKGDRGSYKTWEEGNVPLTVVFEVRSRLSTDDELLQKLRFVDHYGVEEYYVYDPATNRLEIWLPASPGENLSRRRPEDGFVSPRLGIRFDLSGGELVVRYPHGGPFLTLAEARRIADEAERLADEAARLAELRRGEAERPSPEDGPLHARR